MGLFFDHDGSLTLTVSPHRAGLTVDEARTLIEGLDTDDLEADPRFKLFYSFTEIAEALVKPGLSVPDPGVDRPLAIVETWGTARAPQAAEYLRCWTIAYEDATIHEPL